MIKISLITPTRNRYNDVKNLIKSIEDTAKNISEIEILFAVDNDDLNSQTLINDIINKNKELKIRMFVVERSDHFSKDYYNMLSKKADGRWIMAINDDSVFITKNWDEIINNKMSMEAEKYGDDILLGIVDDGMERTGAEIMNPTMSCWVLSSKEYVNLMNGLLLEEVYTWGGDYWIGRVFCKVQYGQRKVYITEVFIDHNSHHLKDLPQPDSFWHFKRIEEENPCQFSEIFVKERSDKINQYIKSLK